MNRIKGIDASLLAMVMVLSMVLLVTPAMAYDHDQTYDANATYFVLEDITAPGYCENRTVEVWINVSDGVGVSCGTIVFNYNYCCANVTDVTMNDNDWDMSASYILQPGNVSLSFIAKAASIRFGTKTKIANLTIHCCNVSGCCGTNLEWDIASALYWVNATGYPQGLLPNVNWANGTYLCGKGVCGDVDGLPGKPVTVNDGWLTFMNASSLPGDPRYMLQCGWK